MSIKVILVPLFGSKSDALCLTAGLAVAQRFGAHVDGLFVRTDPIDVVPVLGDGVSPAIIMQLTEAAASEIERQSAAARGAFEASCAQAAIALADGPGRARAASARWVELTGRRGEVIPSKARVSDLTVRPRAQDEAPPELGAVLEATLFGAGRPLLIVPPAGAPTSGQIIAIAWNGGTEAARAVGWALSFLETAGAVHCLTAQTRRTKADVEADLADYPGWRG